MPVEQINILDWINRRFGSNLTDENILHIRDFSLMWNIFERITCNQNFNIQRINQLIVDNNIPFSEFEEELYYFKQRYVSNGNLNYRFHHLNLRNGDRPLVVQQVLLGVNTNNIEKILTCIIIVYRFRNNLFHGIKDIQRIDEQRNNFIVANNIMAKFTNYVN